MDCIRHIRLIRQTDRRMIDGLQFAIITRSTPSVTSQFLFPPFSFCIAMQGYIIHCSCNSEPILCKIHRRNRKGSIGLPKSILNFHLTTIHQLQLRRIAHSFCNKVAVSPKVRVRVFVQFCYV